MVLPHVNSIFIVEKAGLSKWKKKNPQAGFLTHGLRANMVERRSGSP